MKIKPVIRNYIEYELYHYKDYVEELARERERILEASPPPPDGMPRGNMTGDSTASKGIALCQKSTAMLSLERSVKAVDNVLALLNPFHIQVYVMLYVKKRMDYYAMCDEMHISIETFRRAKAEIIQKTGEELGVIKISA